MTLLKIFEERVKLFQGFLRIFFLHLMMSSALVDANSKTFLISRNGQSSIFAEVIKVKQWIKFIDIFIEDDWQSIREDPVEVRAYR